MINILPFTESQNLNWRKKSIPSALIEPMPPSIPSPSNILEQNSSMHELRK
jgi:hypothetical protein